MNDILPGYNTLNVENQKFSTFLLIGFLAGALISGVIFYFINRSEKSLNDIID